MKLRELPMSVFKKQKEPFHHLQHSIKPTSKGVSCTSSHPRRNHPRSRKNTKEKSLGNGMIIIRMKGAKEVNSNKKKRRPSNLISMMKLTGTTYS